MKRLAKATLVLLALCAAQPLAAADFVVVAATGVLAPAGLDAGQELPVGTQLSLEPWGRAVIRETAGCGMTHVIAGASEHPLQPTEDCSAAVAAAEVAALIQQGAAFAAPLQETGSSPASELVQMLANEPCVFLARVSEEGGNARRCPSGHALRGLRCSGSFCDYKDLLCCPYLAGEPDPAAKELASRVISEEFPNVLKSKHFLNGLACNGPNCDNILPYQFKSPALVNTGECAWTAWSSEQSGAWLDCGADRLMSGIRCQGDYCASLGLYCCAARVK